MGFFSQIEGPIKATLNKLFADTKLRTQIVIKHRGATVWDAHTKSNVVTETETTIYAIRLKHTQKSVRESTSPNVQVGDSLFLVKYEEAPEGMNTNDVIEYGGQALDIKGIDTIFTFAYSITVSGG